MDDAVIEGAADPSGGLANGGIDPVWIGGNGPDGRRGVTSVELTGADGAACGAGASSLADDVKSMLDAAGGGGASGGMLSEGSAPPPLVASGATQPTAPPPLVPEQLQVHGPLPLTALAIPAEHNPLCGVVSVGSPLIGPQAPVTGAGGIRGAVQLTVMPLFWPRQFQFHGPSPLTAVTVPAEQSPSEGCSTAATPLAPPQRPLTAGPGAAGPAGMTFFAEHELAMPPLAPEQVQVHGPSP
jgi:hypothetical protein